jgi:chitinase
MFTMKLYHFIAVCLMIAHSSSVAVDYPVRMVYIDSIPQWWPPAAIATGIGVPGFASRNICNYVALAFWMSTGAADCVLIWSDPVKFFGPDSQFGRTKQEIQLNLKKRYNDAGVKIMISAFGATEFPTSAGRDPTETAKALSSFVRDNNLDGVDIDWEDNSAMEAGRGEEWLVRFTSQLRSDLPNHIITHAPQGPYFCKEFYKNGGYITVNQQVGSMIDFYNVQFYNQGNTEYNTYEGLFTRSSGYFNATSVKEIAARGVPLNKIVVGKPASRAEVVNTGYVDSQSLGQWTSQAYGDFRWYAGVMYWQFKSDSNGVEISNAVGRLRELCAESKQCK